MKYTKEELEEYRKSRKRIIKRFTDRYWVKEHGAKRKTMHLKNTQLNYD